MIGTIYINGIVGQDTTLLDVIRQVKASKGATEYLVKIDSVGGIVEAGQAIYNYLKGLEAPVTTYTTKAFSIASYIFLSGDKRIIPQGTPNALMIHLPWTEVKGTSDTLASHAKYLKDVENELVKFYATSLEIDESAIQSLLSKETYLDATQALEMGFATEIQPQMKAVAMINNKKEEDESLMNKLNKKLSQIFNKLSGARAELILQDATGTELVFPDLEPNDVAQIDEKATVDGKAADGEFVMPDGSTIKVAGGIVKEIVPAEVEEDEQAPLDAENEENEDAPADDKDARIAELEAENAELKAKISELEGSKTDEPSETENKMLEVVAMAAEKVNELETKYQALAKAVGSDYQPSNKKENKPTVKASEIALDRAYQILNSK